MELLADILRPNNLSDIIGQKHLVGENAILTNLVKNKKIFSMILYGEPGIGKTSIANAIVNELGIKYRFLNAVVNNKSDFDIVIEEAKMYGELVLIVDEIHRMNKDKQDILLPYIENGTIILIGLTTANPYFKINPAIRSRCQIFELTPLSEEDIIDGINKCIRKFKKIKISDDAIKLIARLSSGDFRYAINLLEVAYYANNMKKINVDDVKRINSKAISIGDKDDSGHYDIISAFQKSIRGSDVNAALYYLGLLINIGDIEIITRRLSVIIFEDIGLANPSLWPRVMAGIEAANMLGLPEARIPLSDIVIDMSLSPKSNSGEASIDKVLDDIRSGSTGGVPEWIKTNSPNYKYPHDYKNHWVKQQYLPDKIKNRVYYTPCENKYEMNLYNYNKEIKK